jgi:glutathione S-transferase
MCDSHAQGWSSTFNKLVDHLDPRGSAATIALLGDARSTYVRTARMGLAEKGVKYTLERAAPHSPELLAVHPLGRMPGFRDGEIALFETSAILRYVEESFDGPSLLPDRILDRARCEQWVSAINSYCYDAMIRRYVLQYVLPRGAGGGPDRTVVDGALKDIPGQLAILDRAYGGRDYLVGSACCMADLFLAPIVTYVAAMPEGEALLAAAPNARRAHAIMRERPSFKDTDPQRA